MNKPKTINWKIAAAAGTIAGVGLGGFALASPGNDATTPDDLILQDPGSLQRLSAPIVLTPAPVVPPAQLAPAVTDSPSPPSPTPPATTTTTTTTTTTLAPVVVPPPAPVIDDSPESPPSVASPASPVSIPSPVSVDSPASPASPDSPDSPDSD